MKNNLKEIRKQKNITQEEYLKVIEEDKETLEKARQNPEEYRDLVVRIGGYSDYFTRLSPVLQQEIIDRTEY